MLDFVAKFCSLNKVSLQNFDKIGMKFYELTYLLPSETAGEDVKKIYEEIASLIQQEEGVLDITLSGLRGKIKLARPVKDKITACLASLSFHFNPEKIGTLRTKLKEEKKILRYLIFAKKVIKEKPRRIRKTAPAITLKPIFPKPKKVELKEIEKKLEEILGE